MNASLSASVYALSGAGKTVLLELLPDTLRLPEDVCLCLVDAERLEDGAQKNLVAQVAAQTRAGGPAPIFVLTKADRLPGLRSGMARFLGQLRELGFDRPEVYPVCAEAALLFLLPTKGRELTAEEQSRLASSYDRFGPGENCLAGYAVTDSMTCLVGGREVSPQQLNLALANTGVPALIDRLEELAGQQPVSDFRPASAKPEPSAAERPLPAAPVEVTELNIPMEDLPAQPEEPRIDVPAAEPIPAQTGAVDFSAWMDRIAGAELGDLPELDSAIRGLPVDETVSAELRAALARRRWTLQCEQMDALVSGYEEMDCAALLGLAQQVRDSEFPEAIRKKTLEVLHAQFQTRELTELRELTLDADTLDIPGLYALSDRINEGPYGAQSRAPYLDLINHRIDELHVQAMAAACEGLEEADGEKLEELRELLDRRDCADVLKTEFYARIEQRKDELELQELDALTENAELKTVEELETLQQTLEEGSWNPRFINKYRHKVSLCLDAAVCRSLREESAELDNMSRRAVLELKGRVEARGLPDRLSEQLLDRIDERIYRLDLLRLTTLGNDFDAMGFDEIDLMRNQISMEEVCPRSRQAYLDKLAQREHNLVYENAASHAALAQQIAAQFKLRLVDFDISSTDPKYDAKLKQFWGGTGMEQPRDIPAFLLANACTIGLSNQRFWYKNGRDLAFLPLAEIEKFQVLKQRLSLNLQIVRKDSTYLLTEAKLFRNNAAQVLGFLNECVRRWDEPSLPDSHPAERIRTRSFDVDELAARIPEQPLTEETALEILRRQYERKKLRAGSLADADPETWAGKTRKVLQAMSLPEKTKLVWFDTSGLLGSIKDAVAVGPAGFYLLENKQTVKTVPMEDIYNVGRSGKRAVVTTLQNQTYNPDLPQDMIPLLDEYVKAVQLARQMG